MVTGVVCPEARIRLLLSELHGNSLDIDESLSLQSVYNF